MSLYDIDPADPNYVIFNDNGKLIGIRNASEEIKQSFENDISSGNICYILSSLITSAPILENYISIKELGKKNGIRQFEVKNKVKNNKTKKVGLRIGINPGFPKSEKGIDIQVLFEYIKEEIKEVNKDLIEKISNSLDQEFNFEDEKISQYNKILEKILKEIASDYEEKYGKFLDKDENGKVILKDKKELMREILSKENKDRDYIIKNIPAFIMSSRGNAIDVLTIFTGRPSHYFKFEDYKDKDEEFLCCKRCY